MVILSILAIPSLVLLLIAVFIIGASAGSTAESNPRDWSVTPSEQLPEAIEPLPPLPVQSWPVDLLSLDSTTGE